MEEDDDKTVVRVDRKKGGSSRILDGSLSGVPVNHSTQDQLPGFLHDYEEDADTSQRPGLSDPGFPVFEVELKHALEIPVKPAPDPESGSFTTVEDCIDAASNKTDETVVRIVERRELSQSLTYPTESVESVEESTVQPPPQPLETALLSSHPENSAEAGSGTFSFGPLLPGDTLNGRFLLESVIASGGMGVVYKARDRVREGVSKSEVALKLLGEGFKTHPDAWKALLIEMENTRGLRHPNIIEVYDFDHDRNRNEYFMTMEYLEGQPLEYFIRQRQGTPFPFEETLRIIKGIGNALHFAHTQNPIIVHSDIKPSNIFITKDGAIKVLDFGIARIKRAADPTAIDDDDNGFSAYTVPYASCEIMEGWPPDPCDDVYALGCVAYRLLSGKHPFGMAGERYGARYARDTGLIPEPIPGLDKSQQRALLRALAFMRKDRTPSVNQFLKELQSVSYFGHSWLRVITMSSIFVCLAVSLAVLLLKGGKNPSTSSIQPDRMTVGAESVGPASVQVDAATTTGGEPPAAARPPVTNHSVRTSTSSHSDLLSIFDDASLSADQKLIEALPQFTTLNLSLPGNVFKKGEKLSLRVDLSSPSALHVFYFQPGEPVVLVFPNAVDSDNQLPEGGKVINGLTAQPPYGESWFIAIAQPSGGNLLKQKQKQPKGVQHGYGVLTPTELTAFLKQQISSGTVSLGSAEMMTAK